jgi:hydrogenase maturation factor
MKKLQSTDYVLTHNGIPVESLDVIYASESVIELFNEGFKLEEGEAFTRMTDLSMTQQARYLEALNS